MKVTKKRLKWRFVREGFNTGGKEEMGKIEVTIKKSKWR